MIVIKNVILYDQYQHVVGFVELKNNGQTQIKVKHNLADTDIIMTVTCGGEEFIFNMDKKIFESSFPRMIDIESEIVVTLTHKDGNTVTKYAEGSLGMKSAPKPFSKSIASLPPLKSILEDTDKKKIEREKPDSKKIEKTVNTRAAREIDEVLRAICTIDDKGKGICESCPYREYFYGETVVIARNEAIQCNS